MYTFQMQRLRNKTENNKRKHQYGLCPECITPTKVSSNLLHIKSSIQFKQTKKQDKKIWIMYRMNQYI